MQGASTGTYAEVEGGTDVVHSPHSGKFRQRKAREVESRDGVALL